MSQSSPIACVHFVYGSLIVCVYTSLLTVYLWQHYVIIIEIIQIFAILCIFLSPSLIVFQSIVIFLAFFWKRQIIFQWITLCVYVVCFFNCWKCIFWLNPKKWDCQAIFLITLRNMCFWGYKYTYIRTASVYYQFVLPVAMV